MNVVYLEDIWDQLKPGDIFQFDDAGQTHYYYVKLDDASFDELGLFDHDPVVGATLFFNHHANTPMLDWACDNAAPEQHQQRECVCDMRGPNAFSGCMCGFIRRYGT